MVSSYIIVVTKEDLAKAEADVERLREAEADLERLRAIFSEQTAGSGSSSAAADDDDDDQLPALEKLPRRESRMLSEYEDDQTGWFTIRVEEQKVVDEFDVQDVTFYSELDAEEAKESGDNYMSTLSSVHDKDLSGVRSLSSGASSTTFVAVWNDMEVVIKCPMRKPSTEEISELAVFFRLPTSPNVTRVCGIINDFQNSSQHPSLVMPFHRRRDMKCYATAEMIGRLTDVDFFNVVLGMMRGIAHLHKNMVIHRDIALRNFLVSANGRIAISDFGLSRCIQRADSVYNAKKEEKLAWKWCAPETLRRRKSDRLSDIWMLGITIAEFFCDGNLFPGSFGVTDHGIRISAGSFELDIANVSCPKVISDIAKACCQLEPLSRMPINTSIKLLKQYPGPFTFPEPSEEKVEAGAVSISNSSESEPLVPPSAPLSDIVSIWDVIINLINDAEELNLISDEEATKLIKMTSAHDNKLYQFGSAASTVKDAGVRLKRFVKNVKRVLL